jgi:hypothetical protein
VNVKKHFGQRPEGPDDFRSEGNIGNKVAVHDVQMQPIRAGTVGALNLTAEAGTIGSEQRGCDYHALNLSVEPG